MPPAAEPLSTDLVESILARAPSLRVGVLGDLFLDRYLDIDPARDEPSVETGLTAYQVVGVRSYPGALGTVLNNLAALGVGQIVPLAVLGDDGEGHELMQALAAMPAVARHGLFTSPGWRTPTYTKPMLVEPGHAPRELNRLDLLNRLPLPAPAERRLLTLLEQTWPDLDGLVVLDQVSLPDCGVVTAALRRRLEALAGAAPACPVLADSRERIGQFVGVCLKPNQRECFRAVGGDDLDRAITALVRNCRRPVFCTRGEQGIRLAHPGPDGVDLQTVPGYPVDGPIDPVGAGDSTSAGLITALAAGAGLSAAAAFGNLIASITVQQLGTTGTASPEQVRRRWRERGAAPA